MEGKRKQDDQDLGQPPDKRRQVEKDPKPTPDNADSQNIQLHGGSGESSGKSVQEKIDAAAANIGLDVVKGFLARRSDAEKLEDRLVARPMEGTRRSRRLLQQPELRWDPETEEEVGKRDNLPP